MNNFFRLPRIELLEPLELLITVVTFLTVLEFRTVKHPYMGVDVSISKNVIDLKERPERLKEDAKHRWNAPTAD